MVHNSSKAAGLRLKVFGNAVNMSKAAAAIIASAVRAKPELLLCASAGGTPTSTYKELATIGAAQPELFSKMRVLQIDEWAGLPANSSATCAADLHQKLLSPLKISKQRFFGFRTDAPDPDAECERALRWLEKNGPIDICLLGLGLNGHIAMNEPGPSLVPGIHKARLTPGSRQHAMLTGLKRKPILGFTLGMKDILLSRRILLLVSGSHKSKVLANLMKPRVTNVLPASFLWLHDKAAILCDADAAEHVKTLSGKQ